MGREVLGEVGKVERNGEGLSVERGDGGGDAVEMKTPQAIRNVAIVGPPTLSWLFQGHSLSINVSAPLTPFRSKKGSYKPVNKVLLKLWYWLHLYDGEVLTQQVPCRRSGRGAPCTFRHLKQSTRYCVRTLAVGTAPERSREAEQCLVTPAAPAGFPWVLLAALNATFLLLSVAGLCLLHLYVFPKPSEMRLPKTLAPLDRSSGVPTLVPREDALALLLLAGEEPAAPGAPAQPRARRPQEPRAAVSLRPSLQTISFSPGELQESGAGCWVPLSSVRLPASKEEDEEQLPGAVHPPRTELRLGDSGTQQGDMGRAAPGCPCPAPLSTSHVGTLRGQAAAASSEHPAMVLGASEAKCEE
ncbi:Interferon alpha/beta receptor 2-like protein [Aix galericulata]|nr:Interferon alpha/beta receptor 2-like protein [Aix galericulata]